MSNDKEINAARLGLKSKEEMHEMSIKDLELYEDTLYWNRADALVIIQYLNKFGHLKLLKAPEPTTEVEFEEEE